MNRTRIAILMPNLDGGGAERVAVHLANGLDKRGHIVEMVLMQAKGVFLADLAPSIRVVDLNTPRVRAAIYPLVRYMRDARPQALLANMWPITLNALLAKSIARVPTRIVVAEHCTWSRSELMEWSTVSWQVRTSMRLFYPRADGIVAVSRGAADDLASFARLNRKAIKVIYNPVIDPNLGAAPTNEHVPSAWWHGAHKRLLAVGALKQIKDYETLLDAFAQLRTRIDARLLILGEGQERASLEAQVQRLGLQGQVLLPGFVKNLEVYYQHANLFLLSSNSEGFGNVIVEALAAGTPVVSTDCPSGPREILADGRFGQLVPVGNAAALAEAMEQSLMSDHDHEALKVRAQDFSIDRAVDQYEALLFPTDTRKLTA